MREIRGCKQVNWAQQCRVHWNLSSKKKTMIELEYLFVNLRVQEHVRTIRLDWNAQPSLTKLVALPIFTQLLALNLGGNHIANLQHLTQLQAEKLSSISLWNNKVHNITILRKGRFPNLKIIDLTSNLIVQVSKLTELYSTKLQRINLDYNEVASLNHLCKIQNFSQNGIILFCGNPLIQILGQPTRRSQQLANKCVLNNSRKPDINYS